MNAADVLFLAKTNNGIWIILFFAVFLPAWIGIAKRRRERKDRVQ